jgi:hypothetical protein
VVSFYGGDGRQDYLASPDHFLWIEVPLVIRVVLVFNLLQCVINLFSLEHLIPIESVHNLFHFLEGFASSSEVRDKVDLRHLDQLIPGSNSDDDVIIKVV